MLSKNVKKFSYFKQPLELKAFSGFFHFFIPEELLHENTLSSKTNDFFLFQPRLRKHLIPNLSPKNDQYLILQLGENPKKPHPEKVSDFE